MKCQHVFIALLISGASHQEKESHDHLLQQPTDHHRQTNQGINLLTYIESYLTPLSDTINSKLFLTQTNEVSSIYKAQDLLAALPVVYDGIAGSSFYFGESSIDLGWEYGLVNLAAFLAQCMKETIQVK